MDDDDDDDVDDDDEEDDVKMMVMSLKHSSEGALYVTVHFVATTFSVFTQTNATMLEQLL